MSSLTQGAAALGAGIRRKQTNRAYQSAYMGDPGAMEQLAGQDPQLARQLQADIQKRKDVSAQQNIAKQADLRKRGQAFEKEYRVAAGDLSRFTSFEDSKEFGQRQKDLLIQKYPEVTKLQGFSPEYTEQDYNEARTIHGDAPASGSFEGTGMPAQISNILTRGVDNPEYRRSPEYARAWDIASKPTIIDTEEGRVPLYPQIDPMFKPPGDDKPESQEIGEIKETVKQDSKVIKGTEKNKTTADEKVSYGYYNRMIGAEDNIKGLGDFDSASVWEQVKGVTNITASPKLQQFRQAADDWIRAKLRRESGAVIAQSEMAKEYEIYFPRIGDSQAVIDQKRGARKEAERSMKTASGRAHKKEEAKEKPEVGEPTLSDGDLSVTIEGKKHIFPSLEQYEAYKEALKNGG